MSKIIWNQLPKQVKAIIEPFKEELTEKANKVVWNNLTGRLDTIYLELNALYPDCVNEPNFIWYDLPRKIEVLKNFSICESYNFDIEATGWVAGGIIDEESFTQHLLDQGNNDFLIDGFRIDGDRIRCRLYSEGLSSLNNFVFTGFGITSVNKLTIDFPVNTELILDATFTEFNQPVDNVSLIAIEANLNTFNQDFALDPILTQLEFAGSNLSTLPFIDDTLINLDTLSLQNNQITTATWESLNDWALVAPDDGTLDASGNVDSIEGTTTETTLLAKNWTILT